MTPVTDLLGIRDNELVAFVGGGGKSTLMFAVTDAVVAGGGTAVMTTTTKLSSDEVAQAAVTTFSTSSAVVRRLLDEHGLVMVVGELRRERYLGLSPQDVDHLYLEVAPSVLTVEADGSRRRPIKAPENHEPVIPQSATLVVVVMGIDALGRPIGDVAHRPDRFATLAGLEVDDWVTPEACAAVLGHADGGLKGIPEPARVVVAINKVHGSDVEEREAAEAVARLLTPVDRISTTVVIGHHDES